jgi:hypothetical protein
MSVHNVTGYRVGLNMAITGENVFDQLEFPNIYERDLLDSVEGYGDEVSMKSGLMLDARDEIYDHITALETNFALD